MRPQQKAQWQEKGWSTAQIKHAEEVLERSQQHDVFFSKIVFWSALLVIIFANLMVSLVLIPFLIIFDTFILLGIIVMMAVLIGFLYNFLITDIGHLSQKHHLIASIIVPLIAVANMVVMIIVSNRFITELQLNNQHNPWLLSIVFAIAFITPFIVDQIRLKITAKS